jgi:hypothetical protein
MKLVSGLALLAALPLAGCATYLYPGTTTFGLTESRILTYGEVSPALYDAVEDLTLWSPDPSRPQNCPRYVINPDDECYMGRVGMPNAIAAAAAL